MFTDNEQIRYSRHFNVKKIGQAGQTKLKQASVLCVGAGGIGSPALLYLAAAGIGRIGIVDHDTVSLSNLQRQILFQSNECGEPKVDRATNRLQQLNPTITIETHPEQLNLDNAEQLIKDYDIVLDGTDNYPSRYLVNDVCHFLNKPLIAASIFQFSGQLSLFNFANGPCYRCLYPQQPDSTLSPNCSEAGVLGVIPGILGTLAALEVIKVILNLGKNLAGRLAVFDGLKHSLKDYQINTSPNCPLCNESKHYHELNTPSLIKQLSQAELESLVNAEKDNCLLIDVRSLAEYQQSHLSNSLCYPLDKLLKQSSPDLPKDKKLLLYCSKGIRSQRAAEWLQTQGYQQFYVLRGGLDT